MFSTILRSMFFYRRINAIVAAAVAISTAVIGGSLIVGDSVRYSLQQMTRQRLGQVTHVVHGRFVREALAAEISREAGATVATAVLVTAGIELHRDEQIRRAGSVSVLGVGEEAWGFFETAGQQMPEDSDIVLGFRTAEELNAQVGDMVSLWVELPASIPRDSLLGEREDVSTEIEFTVRDILLENAGASRFTLNPAQQLPLNAFVPLATLQDRLGLQEVARSRRNPIARPAMVNTLLIHDNSGTPDATERLENAVRECLALDDLAVRLRVAEDRDYVSAETDRMILENSVADSILAGAEQIGLSAAPTLVYLVNEFAAKERSRPNERYSMYSIVAGMPLDASQPLGPISPTALSDDEIIISSWLQEDLNVQEGDQITARWQESGSHGNLPEAEKTFRVAHVLAAGDAVTVDPGLTPHIPGVTDVESFSDWDQPFEMEMNRITSRDDAYWAEHRATPKAFVSLATAQQLWGNRYGRATSIRIASDVHPLPNDDRLDAIVKQLTERIPRQANLALLGLAPQAILEHGLQAAEGANDFTQLFAGFSFFLILSAVILTSLMFRLGIEQRTSQAGLLHAVGTPPDRVQWFFLGEGLLVALAGALVGVLLAVAFAQLMVYGLTTWWIGAVGTRFLQLKIGPLRLLTAVVISVVLAGTVIRLAVGGLRRASIRDLLAGGRTEDFSTGLKTSRTVTILTAGSLLAGLLLPAAAIAGLLPDAEAFSGLTWNMVAFFLGGAGCLTGGILLLRQRLQSQESGGERFASRSLSGFAMANAARNPWRSLLTTAMIASATFLIVAVAAGRRNPLSETPDRASGNGGFRLIAESSQPVLFDLNTTDGRVRLDIEKDFVNAGLSDTASIYSFARRPGEDASCVNLYQTRLPTLVGASAEFIQRGGFRFANTPGDNPWELLNDPLPPADGLPIYPVIGDMNTLMYSLKKGIGDRILFPSEANPSAALQIVGMLDGSLFQGVLVMSRPNLQQMDPEVLGFSWFLLEAKTLAAADALATVLESGLNAWGMDTESVGVRLAGFLAVQNTYLSTFQLLGGLGLLLGTFGLGVVMLRNVAEREGEIAMLRAVGFTGSRICRLILTENCVLLFWGIGLGTVSALLAMLPHLLSTGADLPWHSLAITLIAVCATGVLASVVAVRRAQGVTIRDNLSVET